MALSRPDVDAELCRALGVPPDRTISIQVNMSGTDFPTATVVIDLVDPTVLSAVAATLYLSFQARAEALKGGS